MSVRIIGAIGWPPTGTDADHVQPGLHITAFPYSASGLFGFPLFCTVLAVGVFRPVHGEAIPYEPFAEIRIADRACGYRAPVAVETNRIAVQGSPRDEGVETVCGQRTRARSSGLHFVVILFRCRARGEALGAERRSRICGCGVPDRPSAEIDCALSSVTSARARVLPGNGRRENLWSIMLRGGVFSRCAG